MCRLPFDVSVWHIAWYTVTNTKTFKCLVHRITQHETFGRWCLLKIQMQHTNFYVPGNLASLNIYCNTHTGQSIHVSVQSWAGATTLCACVRVCVSGSWGLTGDGVVYAAWVTCSWSPGQTPRHRWVWTLTWGQHLWSVPSPGHPHCL